ncbi:MAG: SAM-dependent methyltransferase [Oceanipulchritudo sp.]
MPAAPEGKPSPRFLSALRERAETSSGLLTLEAFIECALYHPELGYYTSPRERVGRSDTTDFYTASSLGPVFARLVLEAVQVLLHEPLSRYTFVEIGPESPHGLLASLPEHPFQETRLVRPGEALEWPSKAVVFFNELLDAQPFRRFVRRRHSWRETAVHLAQDQLHEVEIEPRAPMPPLPPDAPEGYIVDWPARAHSLLSEISRRTWQGLLLSFDYGLPRETVFHQRPQGTGRTYAAHSMGRNLLASPGQCDITCHLVWEELEAILHQHGFQEVCLQTQEAFFMHHSKKTIGSILEGSRPGLSKRKQSLMELLHPDNMGHKFKVLHGLRRHP